MYTNPTAALRSRAKGFVKRQLGWTNFERLKTSIILERGKNKNSDPCKTYRLSFRYLFLVLSMFKVLEGRAYKLQHPWVGVVNRSQADINKSVDMMAARRKEQEYFETSPEYGHLAHKMGAEYLAKLLSKVGFPYLAFEYFHIS